MTATGAGDTGTWRPQSPAVVWLITLAQVGFSTLQWLKADDARAAETQEREKAQTAPRPASAAHRPRPAQRKLAEYRAAAVTVIESRHRGASSGVPQVDNDLEFVRVIAVSDGLRGGRRRGSNAPRTRRG